MAAAAAAEKDPDILRDAGHDSAANLADLGLQVGRAPARAGALRGLLLAGAVKPVAVQRRGACCWLPLKLGAPGRERSATALRPLPHFLACWRVLRAGWARGPACSERNLSCLCSGQPWLLFPGSLNLPAILVRAPHPTPHTHIHLLTPHPCLPCRPRTRAARMRMCPWRTSELAGAELAPARLATKPLAPVARARAHLRAAPAAAASSSLLALSDTVPSFRPRPPPPAGDHSLSWRQPRRPALPGASL